jgi:hypothetical protein
MVKYARWDAPDYIEEQSTESGMVTGQASVRVQLPGLNERQIEAKPDYEYGLPVKQLAAWLPGSLAYGSQPK